MSAKSCLCLLALLHEYKSAPILQPLAPELGQGQSESSSPNHGSGI